MAKRVLTFLAAWLTTSILAAAGCVLALVLISRVNDGSLLGAWYVYPFLGIACLLIGFLWARRNP